MSGHRYLVGTVAPARFRATGLDAAHRVSRRVQEAVERALAEDPEVIEVEERAIFREGTPTCTNGPRCLANLHNHGCPARAS